MSAVRQMERVKNRASADDDYLYERHQRIRNLYERYNSYTHDILGAASDEESRGLMQWVDSMEVNEDDIKDREKWWEADYQNRMQSAEKLYEQEFLQELNKARHHSPPAISAKKYESWIKNFKDPSTYYKVKEHFIRNTLPGYVKNWIAVANDRNVLKGNPLFSTLTASDVQHLPAFIDNDLFLKLSWPKRVALVAAVKGALFAKEKKMPKLHAKAKGMLESAARAGSLSWSKVGTWLERIFRTGAKAELIEQFINGTGGVTIGGKKMSLSRLIASWDKASAHFRAIEKKREKLGKSAMPRGFHFVKIEVFLNWDYQQRNAYLQEAEHRFNDFRDEPMPFLKIRHALDSKDWDEADDLIRGVKKEIADGSLLVSTESETKLKSMENFLNRHRVLEPEKKSLQGLRGPREVKREIRELLGVVPPALRMMYEDALKGGYQDLWSFLVLMYNRVWCHQHGFYDEDKERIMEQEAKDPTRQRMKQGHTESHEVNVIKGDTADDNAIRRQESLNKAQIDFVDPNDANSRGALQRMNHQQCGNRCWWYWTSIIPQGVTYGEHLYLVENIHPKLKKLARELEGMGERYTGTSGTDGASAGFPSNRAQRIAKPSTN